MAISVSFVSERLSLHIHKGVSKRLCWSCQGSKLGWIRECMGGLPMGGPGGHFFFHNQLIQIAQNLLTVKVVRQRRRL